MQSPRRDHERMPGMINGVYAIRDRHTKRVLYVGESHTGRLRETIRRHFNHWIDQGESRESYRRENIEVAWRASRAPLKHEGELIRHYKPKDNTKGLELEFEPPKRKRAEFDDSELEVSLTPGMGGVPF